MSLPCRSARHRAARQGVSLTVQTSAGRELQLCRDELPRACEAISTSVTYTGQHVRSTHHFYAVKCIMAKRVLACGLTAADKLLSA